MIFKRVLLVKSLNLNGSNIFISWFIFIFIYFYLSVSIVEILLILEIWGNNQSKISRHVKRQKITLILEKVYGTDFCILCQEIQRIIHDKLTGTIISSFVLNGFFVVHDYLNFFCTLYNGTGLPIKMDLHVMNSFFYHTYHFMVVFIMLLFVIFDAL